MLAVTPLLPQSEHHVGTDRHSVTLRWQDPEFETATAYHVWVNQLVNDVTVINRVFVDNQAAVLGQQSSVSLPYRLQNGDYKVWVRRLASTGDLKWSSGLSFQLDDDGNSETPLDRGAVPARPVISVFREGQGIPGQAASEPAIAWSSESVLHNVQLYRQSLSGTWELFADIRSVPARSITQRQLAAVAASGTAMHLGDLSHPLTVAGLPEGRYRLWVRAVNGAVDDLNRWTGRSAWSAPVDFEVETLAGQEAIPANLRFQPGIRPSIQWDAIPGAEHYLLSIQRGPDYSNHPIVNLRVYGTEFEPPNQSIAGSGGSVTLEVGAEYFIRVRGVDQYGTDGTFRFGNFAYAKLIIPAHVAPALVQPPVVSGPIGMTFDAFPVISWKHQPHAEAYEIWLSDFALDRRVLLARNVRQNFLWLDLSELQQDAQNLVHNSQRWSGETGLADGRYRFWIRSVNSSATGPTTWSRNYDFTIDTSRQQVFATDDELLVSQTPLRGGSHILTLTATPESVLIGTSGQNFGQSVLARYTFLDGDAQKLVRPTTQDPQSGQERLVYEDLHLGKTISEIKQLASGLVAVICRDSGELYLIDPDQWLVLSRYDLRNTPKFAAAEPMSMEVLANGRLMLSLRKSDSLRVFEVGPAGNLLEVPVEWQTTAVDGVNLQTARADSVSAYFQEDGNYAVFVSMPDLAGTVLLQYQPETGVLHWHPRFPSHYIRRSSSANPFSADSIVAVPTADGGVAPYFLAADRNGFLTWVNATSFDFGFIDLVPFLPGSSRIPGSETFVDPADNGVDSAVIVSLGQGKVLIVNRRRNSLLLEITADVQEQLLVVGVGNEVNAGSDAVARSVANHLILYVLHSSMAFRAEFVADDPGLTYLGTEEQLLAAPNFRAVVQDAHHMVIQQFPNRLLFLQNTAQGTSSELHKFFSPFYYNGELYNALGSATPLSLTVEGTSMIVAPATVAADELPPDASAGLTTYLLVLDATDPANVFVRHVIDTGLIIRQAYSLAADEQSLSLMDRLGGRIVRVHHWRTQAYSVQVTDLAAQAPGGFGGSRNAKLLTMDSRTEVVFNDTSPDIGFTVIQKDVTGNTETITYHAQNTHRSLWTIQKLDSDRILGVTFDGRLLVFNIRNGVFEANLQLPGTDSLALSLEGADFVSFNGRQLAVGSKIHGRVAVYDVQSAVSANTTVHSANLKHVMNQLDIVAVELFDNLLVITEAFQIRRIAM